MLRTEPETEHWVGVKSGDTAAALIHQVALQPFNKTQDIKPTLEGGQNQQQTVLKRELTVERTGPLLGTLVLSTETHTLTKHPNV